MMESYFKVCERAVREAGMILRDMLGKISVRHKKNPFDLVTEADLAAQKTIERIVVEAFPDHGFLGEEDTPARSKAADEPAFCWVADPLDGTTNYVHGVPLFCTSLALVRDGDPICGAVYNPIMDEFFAARKGEGAFLNGVSIQSSSYHTLGEALVSVSFPTVVREDTPDLRAFLKSVPVCQALRRTGSTALNLAYVAAGRFDATWSFKPHPWDVAAGALLVREAGGTVSRPDGGDFHVMDDPSPICAVANPILYEKVMALLR